MPLKPSVTRLRRLLDSFASTITEWLQILLAGLFLANYAVWHVLTRFLEALTEGTVYLAIASFYTAARVMGVPHERIRIVRGNKDA